MNPYRITGPALVSFSGGRTSGYMLRRILDAHAGRLPDDVVVTFANTGKERAETLHFVHRCSVEWDVPIVWLEWRDKAVDGRSFEIVGPNSASREGEPFERLIDKKGFLPNPVTRYCTQDLKIRVMRDYARSLGWERWTNAIGIRADEAHRVRKLREHEAQKKERWVSIAPLAEADVSLDDVMAFWRSQPFDLSLQQHEGNCDLCFLKGAGKVSRILRDRPDLARWWIDQEARARASKPAGAKFRNDRPDYAHLLDAVERQAEFDFGIYDDLQTCGSNGCTD